MSLFVRREISFAFKNFAADWTREMIFASEMKMILSFELFELAFDNSLLLVWQRLEMRCTDVSKKVIFQREIFSTDVTQEPLGVINEFVPNSNVIVKTVFAREKFIAVRTVEADEFFFENFIAINLRFSFCSLSFLEILLHVEAFDMAIEIILHLETSFTVLAFEHVAVIEFLMNSAHVILQTVHRCEGFEAKITLRDSLCRTETNETLRIFRNDFPSCLTRSRNLGSRQFSF